MVVETGANTELGRVGHLVATSIKERSPLEIQLSQTAADSFTLFWSSLLW